MAVRVDYRILPDHPELVDAFDGHDPQTGQLAMTHLHEISPSTASVGAAVGGVASSCIMARLTSNVWFRGE